MTPLQAIGLFQKTPFAPDVQEINLVCVRTLLCSVWLMAYLLNLKEPTECVCNKGMEGWDCSKKMSMKTLHALLLSIE